jgi:hypothetical protein
MCIISRLSVEILFPRKNCDDAQEIMKTSKILPEEDIWFWDRGIGREKGDDGVSIGRGDGGEEG